MKVVLPRLLWLAMLLLASRVDAQTCLVGEAYRGGEAAFVRVMLERESARLSVPAWGVDRSGTIHVQAGQVSMSGFSGSLEPTREGGIVWLGIDNAMLFLNPGACSGASLPRRALRIIDGGITGRNIPGAVLSGLQTHISETMARGNRELVRYTAPPPARSGQRARASIPGFEEAIGRIQGRIDIPPPGLENVDYAYQTTISSVHTESKGGDSTTTITGQVGIWRLASLADGRAVAIPIIRLKMSVAGSPFTKPDWAMRSAQYRFANELLQALGPFRELASSTSIAWVWPGLAGLPLTRKDGIRTHERLEVYRALSDGTERRVGILRVTQVSEASSESRAVVEGGSLQGFPRAGDTVRSIGTLGGMRGGVVVGGGDGGGMVYGSGSVEQPFGRLVLALPLNIGYAEATGGLYFALGLSARMIVHGFTVGYGLEGYINAEKEGGWTPTVDVSFPVGRSLDLVFQARRMAPEQSGAFHPFDKQTVITLGLSADL